MANKSELKKLKKLELQEKAADLGIETKGLKKDELIEAILKAGKANKKMEAHGIECAIKFITQRFGWVVLEKNWSCYAGDVDIIAYDVDDEVIHFIDVKTRLSNGTGYPSEAAVSAATRIRWETCAELYLSDYDGTEAGITFDCIRINVLNNGRAMLRVYRNMLSQGC